MFEVDPEKNWIDPAAGPVTNLIQSLNTPLVAAGPYPAENVQSWIVSRQAPGGGAFDVFVHFHLTQTDQSVVYRWDGGVVPPPQLEFVQEEAMSFCESMGFMMDDLGFAEREPADRGLLLQSLPPFVQDLSSLKKEEVVEVVARTHDPVEEFARSRQARLDAGQASTQDFVPEPSGEDQILDVGLAFDPNASAPQQLDGDEMQIEITEVDGLDLIPEPDASLDALEALGETESPSENGSEEPSGPPLVMGSFATGAAAGKPPVARGRETTPADQVAVIDAGLFGAPDAPPSPMQASATPAAAEEELSIDDMLADVGTSGDQPDEDIGSQLDDILDGVESSRSAHAAPASSAPAATAPEPDPEPEIQIFMGSESDPDPEPFVQPEPIDPARASEERNPSEKSIDLALGDVTSGGGMVSAEEAMAGLDDLGLGDTGSGPGLAPAAPAAPTASPSAPPAPPAPAGEEMETFSLDDILGGDIPDSVPEPAPPRSASKAPAASPLDALDAAWSPEPGSGRAANGNGNGKGSPAHLHVDVDDLARLLAML